MWIAYACGSALFAGLMSILAKCGVRKTDSNVATALRTLVVLAFSWLMVFVVGSQKTLLEVQPRTLLFLILSGLATGASWLCYFRALQLGDVNRVAPVDKSSTVLTILLAFLLLGERVSAWGLFGVACIAAGTLLMIQKKNPQTGNAGAAGPRKPEPCLEQSGKAGGTKRSAWLFYAVLSAVFASLTAILGKVGITGVESNLGTALRTGVVLVMAWVVVLATGRLREATRVPKRELLFIALSGLATGASWLCYYRALQLGPASVVVPIDKLSILVTVAFSYLVFGERLSKKAAVGLALLTGGTLLMTLAH